MRSGADLEKEVESSAIRISDLCGLPASLGACLPEPGRHKDHSGRDPEISLEAWTLLLSLPTYFPPYSPTFAFHRCHCLPSAQTNFWPLTFLSPQRLALDACAQQLLQVLA